MEKKITRSFTTYFFNGKEIGEEAAKELNLAGFEVTFETTKYSMTVEDFKAAAKVVEK